MATLDRWQVFLVTPRILLFPRLELIGHDWAPPIVVGSGEIRMPSLDRFEFTLEGMPDDLGYALSEIERRDATVMMAWRGSACAGSTARKGSGRLGGLPFATPGAGMKVGRS